jgi:serine/arginine repetitive matrix protein 2
MFLTTYYDPFYADLHIYTTKPGGFRHTLSSRARASSHKMTNLLDVVVNAVLHLQQRVWETWGAEDSNAPWPPT